MEQDLFNTVYANARQMAQMRLGYMDQRRREDEAMRAQAAQATNRALMDTLKFLDQKQANSEQRRIQLATAQAKATGQATDFKDPTLNVASTTGAAMGQRELQDAQFKANVKRALTAYEQQQHNARTALTERGKQGERAHGRVMDALNYFQKEREMVNISNAARARTGAIGSIGKAFQNWADSRKRAGGFSPDQRALFEDSVVKPLEKAVLDKYIEMGGIVSEMDLPGSKAVMMKAEDAVMKDPAHKELVDRYNRYMKMLGQGFEEVESVPRGAHTTETLQDYPTKENPGTGGSAGASVSGQRQRRKYAQDPMDDEMIWGLITGIKGTGEF